jgi:glutathione synthase
MSKTIVTPDVFSQITNLKYFQYEINKKETWTRFGFDDATFERNNKHFCDIKTYSNFESNKDKMKAYIEQNGGVQNFVLKPQLEGGANNYFGEEILKEIDRQTDEELGTHILMKRIKPT